MKKFVEYNPNEHFWLHNIYVIYHNEWVLKKIKLLYERMEFCDDIQHREKIACQIKRWKRKFIR